MTPSTRLYRAAARALVPLLHAGSVRTIFLRRSVAAGEAQFPWSDLDLSFVLEKAGGKEMAELWSRYRAARLVFPRLGECQLTTEDELADLCAQDPYRTSLDRRCDVTVAGPPAPLPVVPLNPRNTARRLVWWYENYLPAAVRQGNSRNLRKFVWEIANALGTWEGVWPEPLLTRAEVKRRAGELGLAEHELDGSDPFAVCCRMVARVRTRLTGPPPVLKEAVILDGPRKVVILPRPESAWPAAARHDGAVVGTPDVVQMLLEVHDPYLWLWQGEALARLGFQAPTQRGWVEACLRNCGGERTRWPGFMRKGAEFPRNHLCQAEHVLAALERGETPQGTPAETSTAAGTRVTGYYRSGYEACLEYAAGLRARATAMYRAMGA